MLDEVTDDLVKPTKEGHLKLLEKEEEDQEEDKDRNV